MEHLEKLYMEELAAIRPCEEAEREALLNEAVSGSRTAYERLIEGHLHIVAEIAQSYGQADRADPDREGAWLSELIEEGNVALTMAVYEYEGGGFLQFIRERICAAIEALLAQQEAADTAAKRITAKVNLISDASTLLAKELGREATVAELAERLGMDEEEIVSGMKLAFDAMDSLNTADIPEPGDAGEGGRPD